jgi:tripeptidyl-peptidase-1
MLPQTYVPVLCNLFIPLCVRGVGVLIASGDNNVCNSRDCPDSPGNVQFIPMLHAPDRHGFPNPWVTRVGGAMGHSLTFLQNLGNEYSGLYNAFAVVIPFDLFTLCDLCNAKGRGIPDISSQVLWALTCSCCEGTSCSTPERLLALCHLFTRLTANVQIVAGIVSLLNDHLISPNRFPFDFLNLLLYGHAGLGFNDITSGSDLGCNANGLSAITRWGLVRHWKHFFFVSTSIHFGFHT